MIFQNEIWLAIRSDKPDGGGDGTPSSPYAANTPDSFATKLDAAPANTIIRLMPGIYRTRGTGGYGYFMPL